MKPLALLAMMSAVGCVNQGRTARFADKPIVTQSDDRRPIAEPKEPLYLSKMYLADVIVFNPIFDFFDKPVSRPVLDTNALDEVPDSTWFTNRIGVRAVSPREAAVGAAVDGPPRPPFEIVHAKEGGANPGFIVLDARKMKYLIKFDTKNAPGLQTGTDVVVSRILWAVGYHTSAESVFYFSRGQLSISHKLLAKGKITETTIDKMLVDATRRGAEYRATASQLLEGAPKGGWSLKGTRGDDPNDRVRHERRRTIRGLRVIAAWLNHTDLKIDNTLDMYVGEAGKGHLVHYLVDFGEAFSGHQSESEQPQIGYEFAVDYSAQFKALFAFGLWKRPFEYQYKTKWSDVYFFGTGRFDPRKWAERYRYLPFKLADREDNYWAAKLVMRFDRKTLEAIMVTGQFSAPDATTWLVDALAKRRDIIGNTYLDEVTPLDAIAVTPGTLCGIDLRRYYGLAQDGDLVVDGIAHVVHADGKVCVQLPTPAGYHVARVQIRRKSHTTPPLEVHYVGGASAHLVGLVR